MNPVDLKTARCLIDFSGKDVALEPLADIQIKGATALHNMLADPEIGFAYLADEVGMGKTYIALGVVAMMRYFNPMLRVLYICPSRNVQEKWEREYKAFIRNNVCVSQGRIRTSEGRPAAPYKSCRNVTEMLHYAASGYYTDFFIGKDSFSISLNDDYKTLSDKLNELKKLVPAHEVESLLKSEDEVDKTNNKEKVKEQYARVLNYALPTFDLVVIDEAHNFKHDFESSARNRVLSGVLGARDKDLYLSRMKHALLLSATPYDRDLTQLRNQLKMIGYSHLLPDDVGEDSAKEHLKRFMVRRLNELNVHGTRMSRNMYRKEWRKGEQAEIKLERDEQRLVTALVQKKVGEMLSHQTHSPGFQTGMLASFESFAESSRSEPVQFDGDQSEKEQTDAKDRHVLGHLVDSYVNDAKLGRSLPHPKMDSVVKKLSHAMFKESKKQIIFVRRVKSVSELKNKLDDAYNEWVYAYIDRSLSGYVEPREMMRSVYSIYLEKSKLREDDALGGEFDEVSDPDEKSMPPKNDTFYAWFFRGEVSADAKPELRNYQSPDAARKGLTAKAQVVVTLLEPNWAWYICQVSENINLHEILDTYGAQIATEAVKYIRGERAQDELDVFQACQTAFIKWLIANKPVEFGFLTPLFDHLNLTGATGLKTENIISESKLIEMLSTPTLYTELEHAGMSQSIIPMQSILYKSLTQSKGETKNNLKLFDIHKALMSFVLRTGHGVIDLYIARLMQGAGDLSSDRRRQWIASLVTILHSQKDSEEFSTCHELTHLASHLELIIKNNIPDILELGKDEYGKFLGRTLSPVSPIIGASGATSGRSAQSKKFRMPGYPLALVTTDVFQEGEDLHTFCDSVMHYGLSASPVSLEQKTGRVDRVNSMAQRRLQVLDRPAEDNDLIQVYFPYVKQSIEMLQIRSTCKNYNEFIACLHEVTAGKQKVCDTNDAGKELMQRDEVPDQIVSFLKSPYEPEKPSPTALDENGKHPSCYIKSEGEKRKSEVGYIKGLLDKIILNQPNSSDYYFPTPDDHEVKEGCVAIRVNSAKANGSLLLSLTRKAQKEITPYQNMRRQDLINLIQRISWRSFHRTYAIEVGAGKLDLYFNAEMLVGGETMTQYSEIECIFERMKHTHNPKHYSNQLSSTVIQYVNSVDGRRIPIDRSGQTTVTTSLDDGLTTLLFNFGGNQIHRKQKIVLKEHAGRCVFLSNVTMEGYCQSLEPDELIKYTWLRNRNIDLVEFVVDDTEAIVGRVVHPAADMQWDEFIYCAYTLAVEADNLEYLLNKQDVH